MNTPKREQKIRPNVNRDMKRVARLLKLDIDGIDRRFLQNLYDEHVTLCVRDWDQLGKIEMKHGIKPPTFKKPRVVGYID